MGYVVKIKKLTRTKEEREKGLPARPRLRRDKTPQWQLVFEDRRKDRDPETPRETIIRKSNYAKEPLCFDETWTAEEAKVRCQFLNSQENLAKRNERAFVKKIAHDNHEDLVESVFLPKHLVIDFKKSVLLKRLSQGEEKSRYNRLSSHWKFTQEMIAELQIEPKDYAEESIQFYTYFKKHEISPSYGVKILRTLNAWGQFFSKKMSGFGIEPVKPPRGDLKEQIREAQQNKKDYKGPADILLPEELECKTATNHLLDYNYKWLYLTVWLGLRPEEADLLLEESSAKTWELKKADGENGVDVLWVYQPKLRGLKQELRVKPIPLFLPEQMECIKIIREKNFKRPLNKVLKSVFNDRGITEKRITGYSGRKGFTDLMLSYGQDLEQISIWAGHRSIQMTWSHYKSKQIVSFNPVNKKKNYHPTTLKKVA